MRVAGHAGASTSAAGSQRAPPRVLPPPLAATVVKHADAVVKQLQTRSSSFVVGFAARPPQLCALLAALLVFTQRVQRGALHFLR